MRRLLLATSLVCLILSAVSLSAPKPPAKSKKKKAPPAKVVPIKTQPDQSPRVSSWYVLGSLGAGYWRGFSFFSSLGVLHLPGLQSRWAFGGENQLLLLSKGSLFSLHAASWYRPASGGFLGNGFQLGAFVGPSFSSTPLVGGTSLSVQGEILWNRKIDEMVFLRIFLRTGWIHNAFLAQTGLNFIFDLK